MNASVVYPDATATVAEQVELARRYQRGDRQAGERLVLTSLRYLRAMASRQAGDGCSSDELVQVAVVELMDQVRDARLDGIRGDRMLAAVFGMNIRTAMRHYRWRTRSVMTIQPDLVDLVYKAIREAGGDVAAAKLEAKRRWRVSPERFDAALMGQGCQVRLPETPRSAPERDVDEKVDLMAGLGSLTPLTRQVVALHYGLGGREAASWAALADEVGLNAESARQRRTYALKALRQKCAVL